jgi:hypothetical protein
MLKYSVAVVALLAGTSLACAQQPDHGSNNGSTGMSNSASEHAPGQMKDSGSSANDLAPGKGAGNSSKDLAPGRMKDDSASKSDEKNYDHRSQNETGRTGKDAGHNAKNTLDRAKDTDRNAKNDDEHNNKNRDRNAKSEGSSDRGTSQSRNENARSNKSSTGASEGSEGRSEHRGSIANVTSEQRTRVKTVFSRHHVEPARNLNVSINVGVALPHSVHLYPVPEDIVLIVPNYRGYDYIMLDDNRVAIVDPDTFEIVDIIEIA